VTFLKRRKGTEHRRRVLLIDGDTGSAKVISWLLAQNSYAVVHRSEPTSALKEFKKNADSFDVVIVSARMQGMTGFELTRSIKRLRSDIRTILLTDFKINRSEFRKVFPSSQIDDTVGKPVEMRRLMQAVTGSDSWRADTDATGIDGVKKYQNAL
jgi:DNA-binding response OmpR family regulator